jgi:hypothetical protein
MNGDSIDDAVIVHRPPAPEVPLAVRQEQERQRIFHSYSPGTALRGPVNPARGSQPIPGEGSGPVFHGDVCVLDERGGHRRMGMRCPHQLGWSDDLVYEVEL